MKKTIHNIRAYYRKIINKICCRIRKTVYFENKYGVKSYNKTKFSLPDESNYTIIELNPSDVYLGFDALRDQYTHLDKPLALSPHVDLIRRIYNGEGIRNSQYVKEELLGKLDGRYEMVDSPALIKNHLKAALSKKTTNLPMVYFLNNKYYVIDGKHRLSEAYLKKELMVICADVSLETVAQHPYTKGIFIKMNQCINKYKKNISHLKEIYKNANIQSLK